MTQETKMPIDRKIFWALTVLALAAFVVGCGDDDSTGGNNNLDGSVDTGDATPTDSGTVDPDAIVDAVVTSDASPTDCLGLGAACTAPADCCSDRCLMDSTGDTVCQPGDGCKGAGEACDTAAQCCTLFCDGGLCAEGGICEPSGGTCADNEDCCTNDCDTGATNPICLDSGAACLPLGDVCNSDGNCCSDRCGEVAPGDLRCLPIGPCASSAEVCIGDGECCNNSCDSGLCESLGGCTTVYEPCSGGGECCSGICGDPGTGYPVCLYIGGCTPMGEICSTNEECCSFDNPNLNGPACDVDGNATRCQDPPGCVDDGELCDYAASNNCCSGGSANCMPTSLGVSRCFFSSTECIPTGGACSFSDECCDGVCAPDPVTGDLVCNPGCIPEGDQCTTDADCCSGNCNTDGICGPDEDPCVPLGGACTVAEDCCDPTYLCYNNICAPFVP